MDFHKTFKNYCDVKSSFFEDTKSFKIINFDDKHIKYNEKKISLYSLKNKNCDIFAKSKKTESGISADIFYKQKKYFLNSKIVGDFNLYNILASVIAVMKISKIKIEDALFAMKDFEGVAGRMEVVYSENNFKNFYRLRAHSRCNRKYLKICKKKR